MSGGAFGHPYAYFRCSDIADDIAQIIKDNDSEELNGYGDRIGRGYEKDVLVRYRVAEAILRAAAIVGREVDWLEAGDYGPDTFIKSFDEKMGKWLDDIEKDILPYIDERKP